MTQPFTFSSANIKQESMRSFLKKFDYNKSLIADSEWSRVAPSTVVSIEGTENVVGDDDATIASLELKDSHIRYPFFPGFRTELSFIGDGQDGLGPLHAPHIKEIVQVFDELGTFELKVKEPSSLLHSLPSVSVVYSLLSLPSLLFLTSPFFILDRKQHCPRVPSISSVQQPCWELHTTRCVPLAPSFIHAGSSCFTLSHQRWTRCTLSLRRWTCWSDAHWCI